MSYTLKELEGDDRQLIKRHLLGSGRIQEGLVFRIHLNSIVNWAVSESDGSYLTWNPYSAREEYMMRKFIFYYSGNLFFIDLLNGIVGNSFSFQEFPASYSPVRESVINSFGLAIRAYGRFGRGPVANESFRTVDFVEDNAINFTNM